MLIFEPLAAAIEVTTPSTSIGKLVLVPSINFSTLSITCRTPRDHPENSSLAISSISILNSLNVLVVSVGIPIVPPIATVSV